MWAGKQTRHSHTTAIAAPPVRQEKEISSWPKSKNYRGTTRSIAMSSSVFQKDAIGQPGARENDSLLPGNNAKKAKKWTTSYSKFLFHNFSPFHNP